MLLKLGDLFGNSPGRLNDCIRISVSRSVQLAARVWSSFRERLHEGFQVTDVPSFEFPADYPDEDAGAPGLSA